MESTETTRNLDNKITSKKTEGNSFYQVLEEKSEEFKSVIINKNTQNEQLSQLLLAVSSIKRKFYAIKKHINRKQDISKISSLSSCSKAETTNRTACKKLKTNKGRESGL